MPLLRTLFLYRRLGPVGIALTAFDVWRRIPPQHRKRILREARTHVPRLVRAARDARRNRRR